MTAQPMLPGEALDAASRAQPDTIERLLSAGLGGDHSSLERFAAAERIWTVGIGTSYHAACVGAWILRAAGADAYAVHSFDFVHYPPSLRPTDAAVVFSHRGSKRFSIVALEGIQKGGVPVILITGEGSTLEGSGLTLRTVPQERSAAHSISYTTALVRLVQLAIDRARRRGERTDLTAVASVPDRMRAALALEPQVRELTETARTARMVHAIGGGPNQFTAMEAALKLKEATYVIAEGMAVEQFIHGPIVAVDASDLGLLVTVPGPAAERMRALAAAFRAIGATVATIGEPAGQDGAYQLPLPLDGLPEALSPLVTVVPLQRLAYHLGLALGVNPDSYRRDQPIHAEAFTLVPL